MAQKEEGGKRKRDRLLDYMYAAGRLLLKIAVLAEFYFAIP